jgi:FkbM family methyltransferase
VTLKEPLLPFFVDEGERAAQHRQFFEREQLAGIRANTATPTPVLIDCGANIGTAVHWFKSTFPAGRVVAIEPDPVVCGALRRNVIAMKWTDVSVIEAAAWVETGPIELLADHLSGSRLTTLSDPDCQSGVRVDIRAVDLGCLLDETSVTLLKVDVEGAEVSLLQHCATAIGNNVGYVHVEVHDLDGTGKAITSVLTVLEQAGFEHHVAPLHVDPQPFNARLAYRGVVNPLAVFAWKPELRSRTTEVHRGSRLAR